MTTSAQNERDKEANERFLALMDKASGNWGAIFEELAPPLAEALASPGEHVSCPVHGGQDGFRLFDHFNETGRGICNTCGPKNSGFAMLAWVRNYGFGDAVREVAQWLEKEGMRTEPRPVRQAYVPRPKVEPAIAFKRIAEVWKGSLPIKSSVAEAYLVNRGIWKANVPATLRVHPGLRYVHSKKKEFLGTFPCLLAPIRDKDNTLVSLHRIFLSPDGKKAPVPDAKKMMSPCKELRGSAIRLFPADGDTLGVTEGIETALAVHSITRMPVWSCISATLLELVDIPAHVKRVVVWADLDISERGLQAANTLADRLEKQGIICEICLPSEVIPEGEKGVDWLDVLNKRGLNGFPARWRKWRPNLTSPN